MYKKLFCLILVLAMAGSTYGAYVSMDITGVTGNVMQRRYDKDPARDYYNSGTGGIMSGDALWNDARDWHKYHGQAEYNLQAWYNTGLLSSNVTSTEWRLDYQGVIGWSRWQEGSPNLHIYAKTAYEDGLMGPSNSGNFNHLGSLVETHGWGSARQSRNVNMTSHTLSDINALRQWSGYATQMGWNRGVTFRSSSPLRISYNDDASWGRIRSAAATLGEDWDWNTGETGDIDQLTALYNTGEGSIEIDGEEWFYVDVDYSQAGFWGDAHSIGDSWVDGAGDKHLYLGSGLSTVPEPGTIALLGLGGLGLIRRMR